VGIKTHMGCSQEAYDVEGAGTAMRRQTTQRESRHSQTLTASEEPGPDQKYTLQARKHIAALRRARRTLPSRSAGARRTRASQ